MAERFRIKQRAPLPYKDKKCHFRDIGSGTALFDENVHGMREFLARAPPARRREKARTAWLIPSGERKGKDNLQPPPTSDTPPHPGRAAESYRLSQS